MITKDEGLDILLDVAHKEKTHANYDRVCAFADLYLALITGEGLDDYLRQVVRRESDEMFEQRKEITEHITPAILRRITGSFNKIPRSKYSKVISYPAEDKRGEEKLADLTGTLAKFWGTNGSLEDWFKTRYFELNFSDPNAFVVIEFESTDGSILAQPYPFEVSSREAVDFGYSTEALEYLISRQDVQIEQEGQNIARFRYTIYLSEGSWILEPLPEVGPGAPLRRDPLQMVEFSWNDINGAAVWLKDKPYFIWTPANHNLGRVPAFRIGYERDQETKGLTYVSPYHAAVPYLKKTLKLNSEADLSKTLTAHPYQIRYADPCKHCNLGKVADDEICPVCQGSGKELPINTGQDELVVDMPTHKEDLIDLSKLLVFVTPPLNVLEFQEEMIDKISDAAIETVFLGDFFTRKEIAETATGQNLSMQNAYDTLSKGGDDFAKKWKFSVRLIADIIDRGKDLILSMKFPSDYKLKDLRELFLDLKSAQDASAGPEVIRTIQGQIVSTILVDDPIEWQRYVVRERLNPFTGSSKEEILFALSSPLTRIEDKILYLNMGSIFDKLEEDHGFEFYGSFSAEKQRDLVAAEIEILKSDLAISPPIMIQN